MAKKIWGATETLHLDEQLHVERIDVVFGGYCSRHLHNRKCNGFLVLNGVLLVHVDGRETAYVRADTGMLLVPAGFIHQFVALSRVSAVEIYRAKPDEIVDRDDIHRFSESGILDDPATYDYHGS